VTRPVRTLEYKDIMWIAGVYLCIKYEVLVYIDSEPSKCIMYQHYSSWDGYRGNFDYQDNQYTWI